MPTMTPDDRYLRRLEATHKRMLRALARNGDVRAIRQLAEMRLDDMELIPQKEWTHFLRHFATGGESTARRMREEGDNRCPL